MHLSSDVFSISKRLLDIDDAIADVIIKLEALNDTVKRIPHSPDYDARDVVQAVLDALRPLRDRR